MDLKLCYVDGNFAYFTSQPLKDQWGDDWDDAPYDCNAGEPYYPNDDDDSWVIEKVAFDGPFMTPGDYGHCPYSVKAINQGAVAWLSSQLWCDEIVTIPAGATKQEFIDLVHEAGGDVYCRVPRPVAA